MNKTEVMKQHITRLIFGFREMYGRKKSRGNTVEEQKQMKRVEKRIVFKIAELDGRDFEQMRDSFVLAIRQVAFVHGMAGIK